MINLLVYIYYCTTSTTDVNKLIYIVLFCFKCIVIALINYQIEYLLMNLM